jgi:hypothetical protein
MRDWHRGLWLISILVSLAGLTGFIDPVKAALIGLLAGGIAEFLFE